MPRPSDSNDSNRYFHLLTFSTNWGICFSLKASLNRLNTSHIGPLWAQETRLFKEFNDPLFGLRGLTRLVVRGGSARLGRKDRVVARAQLLLHRRNTGPEFPVRCLNPVLGSKLH